MGVRKILIVDDSAISRAVARRALEDRGFVIIESDSAFGLSSALQNERPDLVLMDVVLPSLHGDKAVEFARSGGLHECPFILYSDRPEEELQALVRSSGASGYVRKQRNTRPLVECVVRILDRGD
jgi:CheY-like chemotaxis protein